MIGQNGSDTTMDITKDNIVDILYSLYSLYSPESILCDVRFNLLSPANFTNSSNAPSSIPAKTSMPKVTKSMEKKDMFDALFDSDIALI